MFMPTLDELRRKLLILTFIYSYRSGLFTLTSGLTSNYYIDGKQVTMSPEGLHATARYILASLQQDRVQADAIGGLTLGADPIAAAVTVLGEIRRLQEQPSPAPAPLVSFIVRKATKSHGVRAKIEGPFRRGMRTVIVDDVLTTGGSVLQAAAAVEEAGGSVSTVFVLVDRHEGGREAIEEAGYNFDAAVKRSSLEELQREMEQQYPSLCRALQGEAVPWGGLPLGELQGDHPALAGALGELGGSVAGAAGSGAPGRPLLQKTAVRCLSAVKAALYHPEGEAEALRLVKIAREHLSR